MLLPLSMIKVLFVPFKTGMQGDGGQGQMASILRPVKLFQKIISLHRADNQVQIILEHY